MDWVHSTMSEPTPSLPFTTDDILDTVREPLLVLDAHLRVRRANRSFYETFQVAPEHTQGRLVYELGDHQWDIPALRRLLEEILPQRASFNDFEVAHDFPSVGPKVVLLNARRVYRESNHTESILLAIEDITERRRLEDERAKLETRFASLVKNIKDHSIFTLDPLGCITSWNREAEKILGYTEAEVLGRHFSIIFTQEDQQTGIPAQELSIALSGGRAEDERWHVRKGGAQFWALGIVTPTCDAKGEHTGFSKILRDMTDRKRAEEAAQFHAALVDKVGQAVIATDPTGRIIYWNRFAETLYGWSKAEALGRNVMEVTVPQPQAESAKSVMAQLAAGENWSGEFLVQRRDGTTFPAIVTNAPIFNDQGMLTAIVGVSSDITDRKQTEEALQRSEQRFRALMEQAPFSVQMFSPDGRTIRVNQAWEELWGVKLQQIESYNILQDRQLEARGILHHIHRGFAGQTVRLPAIQYDPNETIPDITQHEDPRRWLSAIIYPLKDAQGQVQEVVLIHEDITARHRAEEALLEAHRDQENRVAQRTAELVRANEFLKALLENVQTGIVACDAAGVLTLFNSVTRALHGHPEEPLPPHRWVEQYRLFGPDGETPMNVEDVPLYRALQGERVVNVEMVIRPHGLPPRRVLNSGQAFYDGEGKKLGAVVSMQDITQRKEAEEALRKVHAELERRVEERTLELARANDSLRDADLRKDEFLATLAHELRNPLAPLRNGLQLLKLTADPAAREQAREMMERQLGQMLRLVDDLMDISRITRDKLELRKTRVELWAVVQSAIETARPQIEANGHKLTITWPSQPIAVDGDLTRLAQVFWNLLNNSAKYTEPGGTITLSAELDNDVVAVSVRDNGIGIPAKAIPGLFDLFSQVDRTLERAQGGLGIGLALVKRLTAAHDGSVEVHSDGVGRGCTFIVRLPIAKSVTPEEPSHPSQMFTPGRRRRVLVVDDNRDGASSLAMLLTVMGNDTRTAHDGVEGVELAEAFRPELIVLDIGLPKLNGYDACRRIREKPWGAGVLIVAATGWGQEEDLRRSKEAGFDHHFVKPVNPAELNRLLAERA